MFSTGGRHHTDAPTQCVSGIVRNGISHYGMEDKARTVELLNLLEWSQEPYFLYALYGKEEAGHKCEGGFFAGARGGVLVGFGFFVFLFFCLFVF